MVLEKIKNYFQINKTFIISESISIILNDIKSKTNLNSNKPVILPFINSPNIKDKLTPNKNHFLEENIKKRNFSSKSNGKNKVNQHKNSKTNYSFYNKPKDINNLDINKIFINFERPKQKLVHFKNEYNLTNRNNLNKKDGNKSNLKKTKSNKQLNTNILVDDSGDDISTYSEIIRNGSFDEPINETSHKNKPNGINFKIKIKNTNTNNSIIKTKENPSPTKSKDFSLLSYDIKFNDSYKIDEKDFNIFDFSLKFGKNNVLPLIGNYIFTLNNFNQFMNINKFRNWCEEISKGYINSNHYHNSMHAADVTHTCYIYIKYGKIDSLINLDSKSKCAVYLSCICHDYKHPGFSNNYLIETKNPIALQFNDESVLENMHISETFKLINADDNFNIFENFKNEDYKTFRKQMISCVLGTDMVNHNNSINFMKNCLQKDSAETEGDKQEYMNLLAHSSDISNPTKKFDTYYRWAKLTVQEFYIQGDKEKELNMKCSCDRNIVTLYKSQLGFIDYVIIPFYEIFIKVFDKLFFLGENIKENRKRIKKMEDEDKNSK